MSGEGLTEHITQRLGGDGIDDETTNFEDWYADWRAQHIEEPDEALPLVPVKMMLVGLGTDARATRMVNFLKNQGVDISLLTFHGYEHEGKTFLARQVWVESDPTEEFRGRKESREERRRKRRLVIAEFAENHGVSDIFDEAIERFLKLANRYKPRPLKSEYGYTFNASRPLKLPGHETSFNSPLSLRITQDGKMRVTFFPVSVHLCKRKFQEAEQSDPSLFRHESPPNAPRTNDVPEQWYCVLDRSGWDEHKETLFELAKAVSKEWNKTEQEAESQAAQSADTD